MKNRTQILNGITHIQGICEKDSRLSEISSYENVLKAVSIFIHYENHTNCLTCSNILNEMDKKLNVLYEKDSSMWKPTDINRIFDVYAVNSWHLVKEHGFYKKGIYVFWISILLIPIDIVIIVLFILDITYPIFPISLLFYYIASSAEKWYVKKYKKKFIG